VTTPTPPELARALFGVFEPIHALLYFAPEPNEAWTALGLDPVTQGYVAGRAAPLGPVGPQVAAAVFFNFNPALFSATLPMTWATAPPDVVLRARAEAMERTFQRIGVPTGDVGEATELAASAVEAAPVAGRPLAAANLAVPLPGTPLADLWQLLTVLREHRGDGHVAALVVRGHDPVEALALYALWQGRLSRRFLQRTRVWDDATWSTAIAALVGRGWVEGEELTEAGRAARDDLEGLTDELAAAPWAAIGPDRSLRLFDLLRPWVEAINAAQGYPRPYPVPDRPA
jgi:hypothetical protein